MGQGQTKHYTAHEQIQKFLQQTELPPAGVLQSSCSVGPLLRVDFLASSYTPLDVGGSPTTLQRDAAAAAGAAVGGSTDCNLLGSAPAGGGGAAAPAAVAAAGPIDSSNVSNRLANFGLNFSASSAHALWAALNQRQRSVSLLIFSSHNAEVDSWILKLKF